MCGIAGIFSPNPEKLTKTIASIKHRGPDFHTTWHNDEITLGHCLLSIRSNPDRSRQPWMVDDSPWVLVFNGQIYNTQEIKKRLPKKYFEEELDTALLYKLIEQEGWNFISHIQGMFAIGLYNTEEKILRLYRDTSGQKNIYYSDNSGEFIFCSEIKGILEARNIPRESDEVALITAISIGYIPGGRTLFKHIKKIQPGEVITIEASGKTSSEFFNTKLNEYAGQSPREVMTNNVEKHLASKKSVALNLSGGMDSSLLLYEMKELGHDLHTYTTRFENSDEKLNRDANLAARLAMDYGTHHTEISISSDIYLQNLKQAITIIEEPNYNISLATYLQVAKREGIHGDNNRVILSGDGGDEIFGGYPLYKKSLEYSNISNLITPFGFNALKTFRDKEFWDYNDPVTKWLRFKYFFLGSKDRKNVVLDYLKSSLPRQWNKGKKDPIRDMMLLDRFFWLTGENFVRSDKLYMSESLELRSPLAYAPLRDYFDEMLSKNDYFEGNVNKFYLRNLYKDRLPDYITKREDKTGWRSPINVWWNNNFKEVFCNAFTEAPTGGMIDWKNIADMVQKKDTWPGKYFHLYLSLAVLSKKFDLVL